MLKGTVCLKVECVCIFLSILCFVVDVSGAWKKGGLAVFLSALIVHERASCSVNIGLCVCACEDLGFDGFPYFYFFYSEHSLTYLL